MIGFQILAAEQEDGSFNCDKVDCFFSLHISTNRSESCPKKYKFDEAKQADKLYNEFGNGKSKNEFIQTYTQLKEISQAHTCLEGEKDYHPLACDGIIIIPKTRDKFVSFKDFQIS